MKVGDLVRVKTINNRTIRRLRRTTDKAEGKTGLIVSSFVFYKTVNETHLGYDVAVGNEVIRITNARFLKKI